MQNNENKNIFAEELISSYFKSEIESKRFKMNILRAKSEHIELKNIQKHIINNYADIMFLRIPSINVSEIQLLSKLGYEYFQTDTLVYYSIDFLKYQPKQIKNSDLEFKKATVGEQFLLQEMIREIFNGYTNHYFSNQFLNKSEILEGYIEWVTNFIDQDDKVVFIAYRNDKAIAFATCSLEIDTAEGVLYGVMPSSSGGGIYADLIRFTQNYYLKAGIKKMKVSTQVQNYAVQKVWSREGFHMNESYATIHINPLLNYTEFPVREFKYKVSESDIVGYADLSKDYNIIHFDDRKATESGFKGKIAHGLLACGEISRILGTEFPGSGTIFMNYKNIFFAPLYPNSTYNFVLSTPFFNSKGIYLCVIKVLDFENNIVMLSYNQLIKKDDTI